MGSSAKRRRNSVTRSKTGRGKGPKEPVFRLATVESSSIAARAVRHLSVVTAGEK
jgi:hypothetical protein